MERCFWIDVGYACFGIISRDGIIVDAADIARWMVSKRLEAIKPWLRSRKAKVVEVKGT